MCSRGTCLTSHSSKDVVCLQLHVMLSPVQEAIPVKRGDPQETQEGRACAPELLKTMLTPDQGTVRDNNKFQWLSQVTMRSHD